MSQIYKSPLSFPGIVDSVTGIAPIQVNGVSGVAQTGNVSVSITSDGFTWSEKNADFNIAIQNGYFCNAALIATLPITAGLVIGNSAIIFVDTGGTVTIQASPGQGIQIGAAISIPGGIATSNTPGATLELVFKPSDLIWHTISSLGTWTVT